ncbi:tRNA (adenine(22)-N(1))-methyltransferase [Salipaludibacillus daqingensis]|uniref:tRNA (adenine(22)-N(1))-methyltransferase n=1 Tax=Salipaludibacillus daqingensis TaxID=3041001 RepID=UPI0024731D27|nr:tRNA (adenine(22)-N(1))-methyltransferase TrmK [Salipaludibacillus daqingensis]
MNEYYLSKRLEKVGHFVMDGAVLADIGSDHAYLPVHLVKQGKCTKAIAGEVNEGPLNSAIDQINKYNLSHLIKAKLGDGLSVLENEKVDSVVIAGMGGPLIASILENGKALLNDVEQLVLQPNVAADHIRRWMLDNEWCLVDEEIIEEDNHVYEILVAERGDSKKHYGMEMEKEIWMGPCLLNKKNHAFRVKWNREMNQLEKINNQLEQASDQEKLVGKKEEIIKKLTWLKEELS